MYPRQSSLRRPLSPFLPSTPRMETEGPAPSDGEVGEHPDRLPSENRIGRRTDMEKTKNVRKRGLTPFPLRKTILHEAYTLRGRVLRKRVFLRLDHGVGGMYLPASRS